VKVFRLALLDLSNCISRFNDIYTPPCSDFMIPV